MTQIGFAGWRAAFALEGLAMLPVALLCFLVTNRLKDQEGSGAPSADSREEGPCELRSHAPSTTGCAHAWDMVWAILGNGVWLCTTLGYAGYTFSIGAMAVWAPTFLQRRFGVGLEDADLMFGVCVCVCVCVCVSYV